MSKLTRETIGSVQLCLCNTFKDKLKWRPFYGYKLKLDMGTVVLNTHVKWMGKKNTRNSYFQSQTTNLGPL